MWSDLILSYTKSKGLYSISLGELYSSPITQNSEINRRLSMDSILQIAEWMAKNSKFNIIYDCIQNLLTSHLHQKKRYSYIGDLFKNTLKLSLSGLIEMPKQAVQKLWWIYARMVRAKGRFFIEYLLRLYLKHAKHYKKLERLK